MDVKAPAEEKSAVMVKVSRHKQTAHSTLTVPFLQIQNVTRRKPTPGSPAELDRRALNGIFNHYTHKLSVALFICYLI